MVSFFAESWREPEILMGVICTRGCNVAVAIIF
jgi:hypothetical protein